MLKRLYVDNYRCFANFDLKLKPLSLLLGPNGAGKTSVIEIIDGMRQFVSKGLSIDDLAPAQSLTRWSRQLEQRFVLTVELETEEFTYELVVKHTEDRTKRRVLSERLTCASTTLFHFDDSAIAHLFNDSGVEKAKAPFDWSRSSLGLLRAGPDNKKLTRFKNWLEQIQLIRPNPRTMESRSEKSSQLFHPSLSDFACWLRGRFEEDPSGPFALLQELKQVLEGLVSLKNVTLGGDFRRLEAQLKTSEVESDSSEMPYSVSFDELSDGQRLLIGLYAVILLSLSNDRVLLVDEPDNYLSLAEVQPWFNRLQDILGTRGGQVILVSHHPEILNQAAVDSGLWLSRPGNAHVRVRSFRDLISGFEGSASISEIIARGWTN